MKIEGIPEGWEPVRVGTPNIGEWYIGHDRSVLRCSYVPGGSGWLIIRKIEEPKQYRPFANAAEFEPYRGRWMTHPVNTCVGCFSVIEYNDKGIFVNGMKELMPYETAYEIGLRFDDGTPFGIEVTK